MTRSRGRVRNLGLGIKQFLLFSLLGVDLSLLLCADLARVRADEATLLLLIISDRVGSQLDHDCRLNLGPHGLGNLWVHHGCKNLLVRRDREGRLVSRRLSNFFNNRCRRSGSLYLSGRQLLRQMFLKRCFVQCSLNLLLRTVQRLFLLKVLLDLDRTLLH